LTDERLLVGSELHFHYPKGTAIPALWQVLRTRGSAVAFKAESSGNWGFGGPAQRLRPQTTSIR
jgi:hypothetical protein